MKALITAIRLLIAEWLLGIVFSIAPLDGEGKELKLSILNYFHAKVDQQNAKRNIR